MPNPVEWTGVPFTEAPMDQRVLVVTILLAPVLPACPGYTVHLEASVDRPKPWAQPLWKT